MSTAAATQAETVNHIPAGTVQVFVSVSDMKCGKLVGALREARIPSACVHQTTSEYRCVIVDEKHEKPARKLVSFFELGLNLGMW